MAVVSGWSLFFHYQETILDWVMMEKPESWYGIAGYWLLYGLAYVGVLGGVLLACLLMVNVLSAPIYDWVSAAVERGITGKVEEIDLWQSLKLMGEEIKKVLFIMTISLLSFALTIWIPGLNIVAVLITAFLVGWDFYDFPLARRGWGFKQRLNQVMKDRWAVMAFGLWLLVPFVQFLMMPLAVAGGTFLTLESLEVDGSVQEKVPS